MCEAVFFKNKDKNDIQIIWNICKHCFILWMLQEKKANQLDYQHCFEMWLPPVYFSLQTNVEAELILSLAEPKYLAKIMLVRNCEKSFEKKAA